MIQVLQSRFNKQQNKMIYIMSAKSLPGKYLKAGVMFFRRIMMEITIVGNHINSGWPGKLI